MTLRNTDAFISIVSTHYYNYYKPFHTWDVFQGWSHFLQLNMFMFRFVLVASINNTWYNFYRKFSVQSRLHFSDVDARLGSHFYPALHTVLCVFTSVLYDTGGSCQRRETGKGLWDEDLALPLCTVICDHLHLGNRERERDRGARLWIQITTVKQGQDLL